MQITTRLLFIALLLAGTLTSRAQSQDAFCKAVAKEKYRKIERSVKRQVKKHKQGVTFYNGPGSGYQINLAPSLDSITLWLKNMPCTEDAFWDKCQMKIMIYPGSSSIGVKFKTNQGIKEKCFFIQEGTTGTLQIFGWRPKVWKTRNILVYRKMYDCPDFIEKQKKNCKTVD